MNARGYRRISLLVPAAWLTFTTAAHAQGYTEIPIPLPPATFSGANLTIAPGGTLHILGLADTLVATAPTELFYRRVLYSATLRSSGVWGATMPLDTGQIDQAVDEITKDFFYAVEATNANDISCIARVKQAVFACDICIPSYLPPVMKCALVVQGKSNEVFEVRGGNYPDIATDGNGDYHLVWEQETPIRPLKSGFPIVSDSNYAFYRAEILYTHITSDGQFDPPRSLGRGFLPQVHVEPAGDVHIFWLRADSSFSPLFQLVHGKLSGSTVDSVVLSDSVPAYNGMSIYSVPPGYVMPPAFSSFLDDSGRAYAGWTTGNSSGIGRVEFATLDPVKGISVNRTDSMHLGSQGAAFAVAPSGVVHAAWSSYDGQQWSLHYSHGSPLEALFTSTCDLEKLNFMPLSPTLYLDSRSQPKLIFSTPTILGLGFVRNPASGSGSIIYVDPGVSYGYELGGAGLPQYSAHSVVIDAKDQTWVLINHGGPKLLRFDPGLTGTGRMLTPSGLEFSLSQNFPNPFNPATTIRYSLPQREHVTLTVVNILGQVVSKILDEDEPAGYHEVRFDGRDLSSGVYFCVLRAAEGIRVARMVLTR